MADFTYEGTKKKMKVASATPTQIASRFGLKEGTIVVWDMDTGDAHKQQGNCFQPPLIDGHSYEVNLMDETVNKDRVKKDVSGAVSKNQVEREHLINEVISSTKDLNESAEMLIVTPQAVVLVEALTILAGCAPDTTLVSSAMPREKFKRLQTPGSFKASFYQVTSNMCEAFQIATYSMGTIRAQLIDLPDYFVETIRAVGDGNDVLAQKILQRTTARIESASKKCVEQSMKASKAFNEVILDIRELSQATIAAEGTNEKALKELKELEKDLGVKNEMLRKEEQELEQQLREIKEKAREANQKDQANKSGSMWEFVWAFVASPYYCSQSEPNDDSKKEELLRQKRLKNREDLDEILLEFQSLNLEEVDLNHIISYLREGIGYLGKVQDNWNQLIRFFNTMLIVVETNLKENLDTFLEEAKDLASHRLMLQSALKALGYCMQVGNCAQIYKLISDKYVTPRISAVAKHFALKKKEANAKKGEIQKMLDDCENGVQKLIAEQLCLFRERFGHQMESHAKKFARSATDRPNRHAIKN